MTSCPATEPYLMLCPLRRRVVELNRLRGGLWAYPIYYTY